MEEKKDDEKDNKRVDEMYFKTIDDHSQDDDEKALERIKGRMRMRMEERKKTKEDEENCCQKHSQYI